MSLASTNLHSWMPLCSYICLQLYAFFAWPARSLHLWLPLCLYICLQLCAFFACPSMQKVRFSFEGKSQVKQCEFRGLHP